MNTPSYQERAQALADVDRLDYPLLEAGFVGQQAAFHASDAKMRLIFGGNQGGKSFAGCREAVFYATGLHPAREIETPNTGWVVTLDKKLGINELFPTIRQLMPRDMVWREYQGMEDPRFEININGGKSIIRLKSVESGFEKFQSARIRWAYFDEEPDQAVFEEVQPRLLRLDGDQWICMTPTHGMTWVWEQFALPWEEDRLAPSIRVFNWSTYDNLALSHAAIDRLMANIPPAKRTARIYGLFVTPEGLIWPEFNEKIHLVNPAPIPRWWPQYLVQDPAHAHFYGALMAAADPAGGIVVWHAYKDHRKPIRTHANAICDIYRQSPFEYIVDPRLYDLYFQQNKVPEKKYGKLLNKVRCVIDQAAAQYREELATYGIMCASANKDVDAGLTRVSSWFGATNKNGDPMIRIFRGSCQPLVSELRVYSWKDVESRGSNKQQEIKKQEVRKRNDDLCDPLRYLVMDAPKSQMHSKTPVVPGSFNHVMGEHQRTLGKLNELAAQNPRVSRLELLQTIAEGGLGAGW